MWLLTGRWCKYSRAYDFLSILALQEIWASGFPDDRAPIRHKQTKYCCSVVPFACTEVACMLSLVGLLKVGYLTSTIG
jgi:hypothetical protein